jgi:hypothetical protein
MKYQPLFFILTLFVIACNDHSKQTIPIKKSTTNTLQTHVQDSLQEVRRVTDKMNMNVKSFYKTVDDLKLEKGMFPVENYIYDTTAGDGYHYALFYLKFMAAAKTKDKAKISAMIHFPFQTSREKLKYNQNNNEYEVVGSENWKGSMMNEKQFDEHYSKIFTDEILENIPETRHKDIIGRLPGDVKPDNDYETQLQAYTDKGSSIYSVSIEIPVQKTTYNHVHFDFGRIKGEYKILSCFLE